jgi:hypothetical protein
MIIAIPVILIRNFFFKNNSRQNTMNKGMEIAINDKLTALVVLPAK